MAYGKINLGRGAPPFPPSNLGNTQNKGCFFLGCLPELVKSYRYIKQKQRDK